jgi:hypothetical protein
MAGARQRETAARQEAGGAEPRELTYGLSQRRQRKRQGRVTDAPAHMPTTLPMNGRVARPPGENIRSCRESCASTLSDYRGSGAASPDVGVVQPVKARSSPSRSLRWPWTSALEADVADQTHATGRASRHPSHGAAARDTCGPGRLTAVA